MKNKKKKPVVFIVCTGLGRINRGYESFTGECFEALKNTTEFNLVLVKGNGQKREGEITVSNIHRQSVSAKFLAKLLKKTSYYIEQLSFFFAFLPVIIKKKPTVIYYSDFILGTFLWHIRKLLKFKYKLLFCNGAPNGPPYKTEDHVQQLLPVYFDIAVKSGDSACKHTFLPYAFNIGINERLKQVSKKEMMRKELNILNTQKVVLSVGAVNINHKRMNYIINELSLLNKDYFLIILGQHDNETLELIQLAKRKLPGRNLISNVKYNEIAKFYIAADYFVLASLHEGFPRVTVEALSYGLPCIVHDYINTRQILYEYGNYIDMTCEGELSKYLEGNNNNYVKSVLINAAYKLYSWDALKERYINMISKQLIS